MISNLIDYIGIDKDLPKGIKYFKEELFSNVISNSNLSKPIENIISASVDCNINSVKLINTQVRTSNEGQKLTGKKLLVEINILYRIKYLSDSKEKYLYILKERSTKVMYIVLPKTIDDCKIEDLVRRGKIKVECYVEDLYVDKRKDNSVYIRNLLLLNARYKQ